MRSARTAACTCTLYLHAVPRALRGVVPDRLHTPGARREHRVGDVLRVLVKPGDTIAKDQAVLELETDKATIEVPSSVAGKVKEIKVKAGDKVKVGQAILWSKTARARSRPSGRSRRRRRRRPRRRKPAAGEGGSGGEGAKPATAAEAGASAPRLRRRATKVPDMQPDVQAQDKSTQAGQGRREGSQRRSTGGGAGPERAPAFSARSGREGGGAAPQDDRKVVDINRGARAPAEAAAPANDLPPAPAAPSVRRMARELGVDVNEVAGSGRRRPDLGRGRERAHEAARRRRARGAAPPRAPSRLHALGPGRAAADARGPAEDRRTSDRRLGDDSARHAVRPRRHHRRSKSCARSTRSRWKRRAGT